MTSSDHISDKFITARRALSRMAFVPSQCQLLFLVKRDACLLLARLALPAPPSLLTLYDHRGQRKAMILVTSLHYGSVNSCVSRTSPFLEHALIISRRCGCSCNAAVASATASLGAQSIQITVEIAIARKALVLIVVSLVSASLIRRFAGPL